MRSPREAGVAINTRRGRQTKTQNKAVGPERNYVGPYVLQNLTEVQNNKFIDFYYVSIII
jgi:hypothetical protein